MLTAVQLNLCNLLSFGSKFIAITSSKMSHANTTLGYGCFSAFTSKAKNKQVSSSRFMRKYLFLSFVRQSESRYVPQKQGNIPDVYGTHLCVKIPQGQ